MKRLCPKKEKEKNHLRKITHSPYLLLMSGIVLFISSGYEIWKDFSEASNGIHLGVHHGIFILSLIQILQAVPDIIEGFNQLNEAKSENKKVGN